MFASRYNYLMTEKQKAEVIAKAYIDLDAYVQEYKQALVWLTHGHHKENPKPTLQQTQRFIKGLREKITGLLTII